MFCVSRAFASVHCCLVVTCCERADLLDLVGDVYCIFVSFPCGILGQAWYLIVSFPDICRLSYFDTSLTTTNKNNSVEMLAISLKTVILRYIFPSTIVRKK